MPITRRKARVVTDLFATNNDGRGDFSDSKFLPKPTPPDTLASPPVRVQDLSDLTPVYADDDNIDVPASQWIDHDVDEALEDEDDDKFSTIYGDDGIIDNYAEVWGNTDDLGEDDMYGDEAQEPDEYEYYDEEGNMIPSDELGEYDIGDAPEVMEKVIKTPKGPKLSNKPYECPECSKAYIHKGHLDNHMKKKHRINQR